MNGRQGNHEGSITKRADGRWMARVTLRDGTRKALYAKTRQEAARKLAEALRDDAWGLPVVDEHQTVAMYLTLWLETIQATVDYASYAKYRQKLLLHVVPTLGRVPLAHLSAQQLPALYASKIKEGQSGTSVNLLHKVVHRALSDAVRLGVVARNVSDLVDPPRRQPPEMNPLTPDQARGLLRAARGCAAGISWHCAGMMSISSAASYRCAPLSSP